MLFVVVEVILFMEEVIEVDIFESDICVDVFCFFGFGG